MGFQPLNPEFPLGLDVWFFSDTLVMPRQGRAAKIVGPGAKDGTVDVLVFTNRDDWAAGKAPLMPVKNVRMAGKTPEVLTGSFVMPIPEVEGESAEPPEPKLAEAPIDVSEEKQAAEPAQKPEVSPNEAAKDSSPAIAQIMNFPPMVRVVDSLLRAGCKIEVQAEAVKLVSAHKQTLAVLDTPGFSPRTKTGWMGYRVRAYTDGDNLSTLMEGLTAQPHEHPMERRVSRAVEAFRAIGLGAVAAKTVEDARRLTVAALSIDDRTAERSEAMSV